MVVGAGLATMYLVPKIISIVKFKQLMDNPNQRSSHKKATPSLGGIAFFIVFLVSLYFNDKYDNFNIAMGILPGLTILFFLGLKDDLVVLAPSTKLIGQIVACLFVLLHYKFEITTFHGFLGIHGMPAIVGAGIALLVMLTIINAFNLIDGIDGLAASIGIVCFISFGSFFFYVERYFMALSAFTMTGTLLGFLTFNLSRKNKRRIFMGDTGSLLIGFILATMSVRILAMQPETLQKLPFDPAFIPVFILSVLIVPLYDTVRVFALRIWNKRSPFSADRNHLHHILLDSFGMSHRRTSFVITSVAILNLVLVYFLVRFTSLWITGGVILLELATLSWYLNHLHSLRCLKPVVDKEPKLEVSTAQKKVVLRKKVKDQQKSKMLVQKP
jgi:UDP-N-acetylmuramyl pentapeptide phosphotransferase/UDP-N-acetylglucosamine-1-phosphate transferase